MVQACYCIQKGKLHLLVGQGVLEEEVLHTGGRGRWTKTRWRERRSVVRDIYVEKDEAQGEG